MGIVAGEKEDKIKKRIPDRKEPNICGVAGEEEHEWVEEEGIVDSGCVENMCGPMHVDEEDIQETVLSKKGKSYWTADGGKVTNKGQVAMTAKSEDGVTVKNTTQVGDNINRILVAVSRAVEAGNMVISGRTSTR